VNITQTSILSPPGPRPTILSEVRKATADEHQALEDLVDVRKRVGRAGGYEDLLRAFLGFYQPLEQQLARHPWPAALQFEARKKCAWLTQDLQACGDNPDAVRQCAEIPDVHTLSQAWGCLYVIEGSTLGGQHISRFLDREGIDPLKSCFFHSYGPLVSERWKSFLSLLEEYAAQQPNYEPIVAGALDTFVKLRLWFRDSLAPL